MIAAATRQRGELPDPVEDAPLAPRPPPVVACPVPDVTEPAIVPAPDGAMPDPAVAPAEFAVPALFAVELPVPVEALLPGNPGRGSGAGLWAVAAVAPSTREPVSRAGMRNRFIVGLRSGRGSAHDVFAAQRGVRGAVPTRVTAGP